MIIVSEEKLEIGEIKRADGTNEISDLNLDYHRTGWGFKVIREATKEEYIESSRNEGFMGDFHIKPYHTFYEVLMD